MQKMNPYLFTKKYSMNVVGNINILMSKTEGMELKALEHEYKKQRFAAIYGVIDKRKYILE